MLCVRCGAENRAGRKFCAECAAPLAASCPRCGAANEPGERFCGECAALLGSPLDRLRTASGTGADSDGERPTTTSERRLVSVLFADLVGFTTLSEDRDPEEVRELLSRYFETARSIIESHGGQIEKFIGDAVMAVWGTPTAHEDDAERAVRAALELVEAVATLEVAPGHDALAARAAVHSGETAVSVGAVGQGMVAGDLVNTASRLQSVAPAGSVLVGESTERSAKGAIVFEAAGPQVLRGKTAPIRAWRAVRVVAMRGGVGRSEQLEPPFVGRETELRLLKEYLHLTARERRARLVSVIGAAGIGKSRLAWELRKYIDGVVDQIYWHQGRSPSYGEGVTFWALGEMVRNRAGLAETDTADVTRERLAATVEEYVPDSEERRWIAPRLLQLLGLEEGRPSERDELFAAWRTFFERVADRGPTILLFEDLHWADPGLIDFIDHVLERSRAHPILIVTMARPELYDRRPDWATGRRNFVAITLEPLPDEALGGSISALVPGLSATAVGTIVDRAEGIPLYAVETVRMLIQEGRIVEEDGVFHPVGNLSDLRVPESLQALIASRIDTLSASERGTLLDAAVLGHSFTLTALAAVADEPPDALEPRLRNLVKRDMLSLNADPRSPERGQYSFVHRLIREVAYGRLSKADRRSRHLAAARHFESLGDDELAGALATHYLDAYRASPQGPAADTVAAQARVALRAAAERALSLHSNEQALAYLEHALTVTVEPGDRAVLLERAGAAAQAMARFDDAEQHLAAAISLFRAAGDRAGVARATASLGLMRALSGQIEPAIELLRPALAELGETSERAGVELTAALARAYALHDEDDLAIQYADRALVVAERLDLVALIADAVMTKGVALAYSGRWREAGILMTGVLKLAEEHGLRTAEFRAQLNISQFHYPDDPREAMSVALAGVERAAKFGSADWEMLLRGNVAMCALPAGEWDLVIEMASLQDDLTLPVPLNAADSHGAAAIVLAFRGEGERARAVAAALQAAASVSTDLQYKAIVDVYRAGMALADGHYEEAASVATDRTVDVTVTYRTYVTGAHACLALRDPARARSMLVGFDRFGVPGRWASASRRTVEAGIAALEGRRAEAVAAYTDAAARWRELRLDLELALCQVECASLLGPGDEVADSAAAEARTVVQRLGAATLAARLHERDRRTPSEHEPSVRPAVETVSTTPRT